MKRLVWALCLLVGSHVSVGAEETDHRFVRTLSSPSWTQAVGRLLVPHPDGSLGNCSVSLIGYRYDLLGSVVATSAAHCFHAWLTAKGGHSIDENHEITFASKNDETKLVRVKIAEFLFIERDPTDLAIIKLDKFIPADIVKPLIISPYNLDSLMLEDKFRLHGRPIFSIAGHSTDAEQGNGGENLTIHRDCDYISASQNKITTTCDLRKGASGGAAVVSLTIDKTLTRRWPGRQDFLVGIPRSVNLNNEKTYFYPTQDIRRSEKIALQKANRTLNNALKALPPGSPLPREILGTPIFRFE